MWKFPSQVKESFFLLNRYVVLSFSLTFAILLFYLLQVEMPTTALAYFYLSTIPTYYFVVVFLLSFVLFPLYFFPYLKYLAVIPKSIFDSFLVINFLVFKAYKFHIDSFVMSMILHDAQGIGLSTSAIGVIVAIILSIFFVNYWFFYKAKNIKKSRIGKLALIIFLLFIINQLIHIWGAHFRQQDIISPTPYFPYYLPTTSYSNMKVLQKKYPAIIPKPKLRHTSFDMEVKNKGRFFNYPLAPIKFNQDKPLRRPNILLFVVESWRADMLTEDVTPNMYAFSKKNSQFDNHFSGGNVTVAGLFSILFGINSTNLQAAQSSPFKYQSVFVKSLKSLGYSVSAFSSTNLDRFSLKDMSFGKIDDAHFDQRLDKSVIKNDDKITSDLIKSLKTDKQQPWFKFIFLASSHHSYEYPDAYKKFSPIPSSSEAFLLNKDMDPAPFLNDYKNSLLYVDSLFEKINKALEDEGRDDTIIVITSDHGEEFNDNGSGFWGHGSNFTKYQTLVPLVIHMPKQSDAVIYNKRSSHVDIVPTLLKQLGVTNRATDYSEGYDLFNLPKERNLIFSSYKNKGYLIGNIIYDTGLLSDSYQLDDVNQKNNIFDYQMINEMKIKETSFFK